MHDLGVKGKDLFLLRKRMEYPELKRGVQEQCEAFGATVVLIEDKASGTQLIQKLVPAGPARGHPLSAAVRQDHAQARPDRGPRLDPRA
jgi:hypothetical protein